MREIKVWWKRGRALGMMALVVLLAGLLVGGCKQKEEAPEPAPEPAPAVDPAQAAKKKLLDSLLVPPGSELKNTELLEHDLQFTFWSKSPVESLNLFFNEQVTARGYAIVMNTPAGINYVDQEGRRINISWFVKDPDLHEGHQSSFMVAVQPLPPELRNQ